MVENEAKMAYMKPSGSSASSVEEPRGPSKGFVVREAPWTTGNEKVNNFLPYSYSQFERVLYFRSKKSNRACFLPVK